MNFSSKVFETHLRKIKEYNYLLINETLSKIFFTSFLTNSIKCQLIEEYYFCSLEPTDDLGKFLKKK